MRKRSQRKSRPKKIKRKMLGFIAITLIIIVTALIVINWDNEDYQEKNYPQLPVLSSQLPDLDSTGIGLCMKGDVQPYSSFADDFFWNESSVATTISIWGSFSNDILPKEGIDSLTFQIIIHDDNNNKPGSKRWEKTFISGDYLVKLYGERPNSWYCSWSDVLKLNNHIKIYQYDFIVEEGIDFFQNNTDKYWLEVRLIHRADIDYGFGWKTTRDVNNLNKNAYSSDGSNWIVLKYPYEHDYGNQKMNLAFAIH